MSLSSRRRWNQRRRRWIRRKPPVPVRERWIAPILLWFELLMSELSSGSERILHSVRARKWSARLRAWGLS